MAQPVQRGALPPLFAATQPVSGGAYIGPDGFAELRGHPGTASRSRAAQDDVAARRLWAASEALTGVTFEFDRDGVPASA